MSALAFFSMLTCARAFRHVPIIWMRSSGTMMIEEKNANFPAVSRTWLVSNIVIEAATTTNGIKKMRPMLRRMRATDSVVS